MSKRKAICPAMSRRKRCSGRPLKKPNSNGVKKDEYTAHISMNCVHILYHLDSVCDSAPGSNGLSVCWNHGNSSRICRLVGGSAGPSSIVLLRRTGKTPADVSIAIEDKNLRENKQMEIKTGRNTCRKHKLYIQ